MPIGYISYISHSRSYGFIDSPELDMDHIFFRATNCKKYTHIHKGDKVSFEFNPAVDGETGAREIKFLQNASLEALQNDFRNGHCLKGFLKKIGNRYYVKDKETYIFIRLIIACYEINIKEVYEDNLNKLIDYKIFRFTHDNKIRAININRQYLPECELLIEGNKTEGEIVLAVKGGYQIRVYDNVLGFLPQSLAAKSKTVLDTGELVNVTCIKASNNLENVIFDLTENLENVINFKIEQEKFISSLKLGDKFLGKIKVVQGFGAFISFGLTVGLLHISKIIAEHITLSKESRKQLTKMFEKVFYKGREIEIIIDKSKDDRLSLTWDKNSELNNDLYNDIYTKFKILMNNDKENQS